MASVYATLSCMFVFVYSKEKAWAFEFDETREHLIAICELLTSYAHYAFVVPLFGFVMCVILKSRSPARSSAVLAHILYLFAATWVLLALVAWATNEIPFVSLRGLS